MGKFSIDSKMGDLLKDPKAVAILEEYYPGMSKDTRMKMVAAMTLKALSKFPQAAAIGKKIEEIDARLKAIE
jgi:hypothetical protein